MALPPFKRVVTGHNADGRAVISWSGEPAVRVELKSSPGTVFYEIWKSFSSPALIDNAPDPTPGPLQLHPAPLGSNIRVVDIPPDSKRNASSATVGAAQFAELGAAHASTGAPGAKHKFMHRTETLDYGIVLAGEVWLVLDEDEIRLQPGDIVVQRGTNHAWSNRTEDMVRMAFILLDGRFSESLQESAAT
jgi:quercetin dioxygenase-like cupin family protein